MAACLRPTQQCIFKRNRKETGGYESREMGRKEKREMGRDGAREGKGTREKNGGKSVSLALGRRTP